MSEATPRPTRSQDHQRYFPDLDGLRALAVVPVVLYHAGAHWLPGGFVGVDIFFVLSGFFITRLLAADLDQRRFSIWRFYERRARRILPALFFALAVTACAASLILTPPDLIDFAKSLLATLGFGSNIYFWKTSGYFAQAAELKPLLHTWSLAVEEQYYILFPPALWVVARFGRRLVLPLFALAAVVSLTLCVWAAYNAYLPASFYWLPTRAWELLVGALIALAPAMTLSRRIRDVLSLAGLALIAGSLFLISERTPFPGWAATFPVAGAALLVIASVAGGGLGNLALTGRPTVFVGQISYSLYLWHWPPLALATYLLFRPPNMWEAAGLVALSTLGAVVSWRFVEQPFRGSASPITLPRLVLFSLVGVAALGSAGLFLVHSQGLPSRFTARALSYFVDTPTSAPVSCFSVTAAKVAAGEACTIGAANAQPRMAIWGDSHAWRSAETLAAVARRSAEAARLYNKASCPPLLDVKWAEDTQGCRAFNTAVLKRIAADRPQVVILSGFWTNYATGARLGSPQYVNFLTDGETSRRSAAENQRVFERGLRRTVHEIRRTGAKVMIIGPYPELPWSAPTRLAMSARLGAPPQHGPTTASFLERNKPVLDVLESLGGMDGVVVVYPHKVLCDDLYCRIEQDGQRLYLDDNHVDALGNRLLEPTFTDGLSRLRAQPESAAPE